MWCKNISDEDQRPVYRRLFDEYGEVRGHVVGAFGGFSKAGRRGTSCA